MHFRPVYGLVSWNPGQTAFPRPMRSGCKGPTRLTYRCGGSAGFDFYRASPDFPFHPPTP